MPMRVQRTLGRPGLTLKRLIEELPGWDYLSLEWGTDLVCFVVCGHL